jgi:hypothetical protein
MSGSLDTSDILVVVDKGEQYNVNIQPPDQYGISIKSGDTYIVNIDLPTAIVATETDNYYRVADFALFATTASFFSGVSASVNWNNVADKPSGLVSSSTQVNYNQIQNQPTLIASASFALTASYVSGAASTWDDVADKPNGLVSSSNQIVEYNIFATTGSNTFIGSQLVDGNITADNFFGTASIAENVTIINAGFFETSSESYIIPTPEGGLSYVTSASYALTASYTNAPVTWNAVTNKPSGLVSSSIQASSWSVASASVSISASFAPSNAGIISSSTQISQSGFISSSTINVIQTITSASYAAITPVSGTLYILIG